MSKMSELSMVIDEMITCGEGIIKAIQDLTVCGEQMIKAAKLVKEIFSTENLPEPKAITITKTKALPVKEEQSEITTYSKEEVRGILSRKSANGYSKEVKSLLSKYGADKLSTLSSDDYTAVVAEAEVIGNA
ncbi:MAG: hypothetical protein KMY55_07615 [Dethiosulfatibacter sp.]|nr:hypothetical protein [Dethiosulfatibacter sp.]